MEVALVSHASVLIKHRDVGVWTDPWLVSKAFNSSWSRLPGTTAPPTSYDSITHIWLSHEHPDHFNIPTLKSLPAELKERVTVLFQEQSSSKIADALAGLGFRHVVALRHRERRTIGSGVEVYCYQNHLIDSCLAVVADGHVVLDVNDAELGKGDCRRIRSDLGKVDVVLNQFSIAGYLGLQDRERYLPRLQTEKLDRVVHNHRDLRAATTVPFASFVYFSTPDNAYLNRYVNTPEDVVARLTAEGLDCTPMFPGDEWDVGRPFDSTASREKLRAAFQDVAGLPLDASPVVPLGAISAELGRFASDLHDRFPSLLLRAIGALTCWIPDLQTAVRIDIGTGELQAIELAAPACDLVVHSQPLQFAFKFPFGIETLAVSGRLLIQHNFRRWQLLKRLSILNSAEIYLAPKYLGRKQSLAYLGSRVRHAIVGQIARRLEKQRAILGS